MARDDTDTGSKPIYKLIKTHNDARNALVKALREYELSGDHDHGWGPIKPGGECGPGKDCWVRRVRKAIAAFDD